MTYRALLPVLLCCCSQIRAAEEQRAADQRAAAARAAQLEIERKQLIDSSAKEVAAAKERVRREGVLRAANDAKEQAKTAKEERDRLMKVRAELVGTGLHHTTTNQPTSTRG